jgi:histidinol-phosphate/aromatic aminotransferase/cobyric acid decarboxylase-like protein
VLTTLAGPGVTVLSDELNHASIVDGCRLAKATVRVFRHGDLDQVDALLAAVAGPALVVTDSAFSMDGDVADLEGLTTVCSWYGALLVLDEAHAVLGPNVPVRATGAAVRSRHDAPLLRMGTLSKTLGSLGGFVAGPRPYVDLLRNRARSFIFTTASTPADTAAGLAALRVVRSADGAGLVARLRHHVDRVAPGHPTPILPVVLGDEAAALDGSSRLLSRGLLVPAIRPPTVPPGTSRLRVALSAAHTDEQVDRLLAGLAEVGYRPPITSGPASAPVARPVRVAPAPLADATRPGARPAAPFAARSPRDVPGGMAGGAGDAPDGIDRIDGTDGIDAVDGVPGDVAREVADLAAAGAPAGARVVRLASGRVGDGVAPTEARPAGPLNGNGVDGGPAGGGEPT